MSERAVKIKYHYLVMILSAVFLFSACGQADENSQLINNESGSASEESQANNENNDADSTAEEEKENFAANNEEEDEDTESSGNNASEENDNNADGEEDRNGNSPPQAEGELEVHFIDVGQGDATLLKGPDFTILVDTGRHDRNDVVPYLERLEIETIDLLIGTHPHADHIGQMDRVIEAFEVEEVWMSGAEHTTQNFERVLDAILSSEASYHEPRAGEDFTIGSSLVEVVHPEELIGDLNEDSVSVRVVYGEIIFLFTGDAEEKAEKAMINSALPLDAHILQLGHHGSSTSSSAEFLDEVSPEIGIYSAGAENSYGHPHSEVVDRFDSRDIPLYGTDVHGNIIVRTDGESYSVSTEDSGNVAAAGTESESEEETAEENQSEGETEGTAASSGSCIDINSASTADLTEIIHIGEARAEELVNLRPFGSVDELTRINGIGDARVNDIKEEGLACAG